VWLQGFVADWSELKPELLTQIDDVGLVAAELEPMLSESAGDPSRIERQMINLPVRLQVPDIPGGATAAAWREIGGKLITPWVAAGAVLVVAGWGLRNLLKLTERRMQFAYAVTHELRTPLTTFQLYSDMLSAGMVPEEAKQSYLETLYRESARLSNLVEGVLEYARLENQRVRLTPREIDAASLLSVIGEHLERRCHENGVTPKTEASFANGLPLRTDVDVVNRIAGVLVNNAVRHAQGAGDATVLVRLSGDNGEVHLDVIDSGPGVDRADARAIFRPFRRGRKADAAAQGGIGLGLALARSWARLLGGKVELAARHDPKYGGAHFRLRFPARLDS
jgi:signal transduction histidine kinase